MINAFNIYPIEIESRINVLLDYYAQYDFYNYLNSEVMNYVIWWNWNEIKQKNANT